MLFAAELLFNDVESSEKIPAMRFLYSHIPQNCLLDEWIIIKDGLKGLVGDPDWKHST